MCQHVHAHPDLPPPPLRSPSISNSDAFFFLTLPTPHTCSSTCMLLHNMFMHAHVHMKACGRAHTCSHANTWSCTHVCSHSNMWSCIHMQICGCAHTCSRAHMFMHTHIFLHKMESSLGASGQLMSLLFSSDWTCSDHDQARSERRSARGPGRPPALCSLLWGSFVHRHSRVAWDRPCLLAAALGPRLLREVPPLQHAPCTGEPGSWLPRGPRAEGLGEPAAPSSH